MTFNNFDSTGTLIYEDGLIIKELSADDSIAHGKFGQPVTIKSLFAEYNGDYIPEEFDWGKDVGKEIIEDE